MYLSTSSSTVINNYALSVFAYHNTASQTTTFANAAIGGTVKIGTGTTSENVTANINYNATTTITATAKTGYTFAGWYLNTNFTTTAYKTDATITTDKMPINGLTYYAKFTINSFAVTLNKGTGISAVTGESTYYYGTTVTVSATASNGYTFSGWTVNAGGVSVSNNSFTMPNNAVTLTAKATANPYTITYQANGGTLSGTAHGHRARNLTGRSENSCTRVPDRN